MLSVNNISFNYTKNKPILQGFNLSLQQGDHLCVMGESGCGKSTLLKAIYGLVDLNQGEIFWEEEQIFGPKKHLVPGFENFKYIAQDFDLMPYISVSEKYKKILITFSSRRKRIKNTGITRSYSNASF